MFINYKSKKNSIFAAQLESHIWSGLSVRSVARECGNFFFFFNRATRSRIWQLGKALRVKNMLKVK